MCKLPVRKWETGCAQLFGTLAIDSKHVYVWLCLKLCKQISHQALARFVKAVVTRVIYANDYDVEMKYLPAEN